jgi:hypothetical protein
MLGTVPGAKMERFTNAIRRALEDENWHGALFMALGLPDICGHIENKIKGSEKRYVNWYERYMVSKYTQPIGPDQTLHVFLGGADCYALQCSYFHEGDSKIDHQRARNVLSDFIFVEPTLNGEGMHMNQFNDILQLNTHRFCMDMCESIDEWIEKEVKNNQEYLSRIDEQLLKVRDVSGGLSFPL